MPMTTVANPSSGLSAQVGELVKTAAPLLVLVGVVIVAKSQIPNIENVLTNKITALTPATTTSTTTTSNTSK